VILFSSSLMKRVITQSVIAFVAVVMIFGAVSPAMAAKEKIDICHFDEELGELVPISISKKALKAHAKNHANDTLRDADGMCVNGEPLKA